jgi:hypothetical protein
MEETAFVYNNTFVGCNYGLTISPGLLILNNIFLNSKTTAIGRGVYVNDSNDKSITDYSIFYNNKSNFTKGVILGENNLIDTNPLLNEEFKPSSNSPCIDKGASTYEWKDKDFIPSQNKFVGESLDIGAVEFGTINSSVEQQPIINIGGDVVVIHPRNKVNLQASISYIDSQKTLTYSWKKISGSGKVKFLNQGELYTSVQFSEEGIYEIKLTGFNDEYSTSDIVTIYFVNDFEDRIISVGMEQDVLLEAEDYRYLVGSAKVIPLLDGKGVKINLGEILSYTQYQVSTTASGTYYVWVRIKGQKGKVIVSFNDSKNKKEIGILNNSNGFIWDKVEFAKVPEGIYPLRISATGKGIIVDKIFITLDPCVNPSK